MKKKPAINILLCVLLLATCKKDEKPAANTPPIAKAGSDKTVVLVSCRTTGQVELDGSGSTNPNTGTKLSYRWTRLSGPTNVVWVDSLVVRPLVLNLLSGQYSFELTVTNVSGLSAKDTVGVLVTGAGSEYDLDLTFTGTSGFKKKYEDCYYRPCSYYDVVTLRGSLLSSPLGELRIYGDEFSDTAALSYANSNYFAITNTGSNFRSIYGTTDINFKKLVEQGGGGFTGKFKITGGTAQECGIQLTSLAPLSISGNINVNTSALSINIKGKTFF